ncbi:MULTISPECIES: DNA double-strand break repair nuclease NurA [Halorubrum]|uniref:Nuclease n=1 Tax=Halorubrum tropicale TaxID=1765655 RepID=A0A0N0BRH1_9EURY|nr:MULTISPECIES: DNA double-strand break repair nuclease NurA [Halorubrum]KOX96830.1 nuclease [Halorubrum tropicale]TKX45337.1 DNA double-strand break repair nuclease NurA [Halorubrum sp. ARQ200]TKX51489.1 DNA double-strand break repair nuclease NurA [Halorubrum sp. ASP121]TKX61329.1 DNA double-strand break repair nuclease NurA [Halorubrum sp. ASP1]
MTLDPIHVENIARLAYGIGGDVDATDHDDLAERVWREWLPELRADGRVVVEALGDHERRRAAIDDVALAARPYETVHGLDSGTINPTTFKNGLVVDVAHAAMASSPTDLDLHRDRTIVATVHAGDSTAGFDSEWTRRDEGHTRQRVFHVPRVNRYAERVVHALALYLAEGTHALDHADEVDELLVLDGPVYPKELFTWADRDPELGALAREAKPRAVVEKYVRLVERFVERDVPLAGFVKNPASTTAVRALARAGVESPWPDDTALFTRLLERREPDGDGVGGAGAAGDRDADRGARLDDDLTFTTWFRSRGGADAPMAADGDALGVERELDPALYEPTFMVVYDPRTDVTYKLEAPYAFARDPATRERLTRQVVAEVAATRGPPEPVAKADELARISATEKAALRRKFEERLGSDQQATYDDLRWGTDGY